MWPGTMVYIVIRKEMMAMVERSAGKRAAVAMEAEEPDGGGGDVVGVVVEVVADTEVTASFWPLSQ